MGPLDLAAIDYLGFVDRTASQNSFDQRRKSARVFLGPVTPGLRTTVCQLTQVVFSRLHQASLAQIRCPPFDTFGSRSPRRELGNTKCKPLWLTKNDALLGRQWP